MIASISTALLYIKFNLLVLKLKKSFNGELPSPLLTEEVGDDGRFARPMTMTVTVTVALSVTMTVALTVTLPVPASPGATSTYNTLHLMNRKVYSIDVWV
jgi:hypothetical protein